MSYSFIIVFLLVSLVIAAQAYEALIVKCVQRDGSVLYINTGCDSGMEMPVHLEPLAVSGSGEAVARSKEASLPQIPLKSAISSGVLVPAAVAVYLLMSLLRFALDLLHQKSRAEGNGLL